VILNDVNGEPPSETTPQYTVAPVVDDDALLIVTYGGVGMFTSKVAGVPVTVSVRAYTPAM
jgi:hypothetical protein